MRAKDGTEDFAQGDCCQYVNLPTNDGTSARFDDVDEDRNRHGPTPRIRVKFSQPGARQFTITSEVEWGGAAYNATGRRDIDNEVARNPKFIYKALEQKTYTSGADGAFLIPAGDFVLPASGGDRFRLRVNSEGVEEATSYMLTSKRFLALLVTRMPDANSNLLDRGKIKGEFLKAGIRVEFLSLPDCAQSLDLASETHAEFREQVRQLAGLYDRTTAREFAGYAIELVVAKNLASPRVDEIALEVDASRSKPKRIQVKGCTNISKTVEPRYLWSVIEPGGWFIEGQFCPESGGSVPIHARQCSPSDDHRNVHVTLEPTQAGPGTISLKVKYIQAQTLGSCVLGTNLILVSTHSRNQPRNAHDFNRTVLHEIGHSLGMVVGPPTVKNMIGVFQWATFPNKSENHYVLGGTGPHCHTGIPWNQGGYRNQGAQAQCVMYEASCAADTFCRHCIATIRKIDLSDSTLIPLYAQ